MHEYKAVITNVVDGDTFDMDIDLGFNIHIHERVRLLNVDTPENRSVEKKLGKAVTQYAQKHFEGKEVLLQSRKNKTDSFGRWLAEVYVDGSNIKEIYDVLGVNKKNTNYSEKKVEKLFWEEKLNNDIALKETDFDRKVSIVEARLLMYERERVIEMFQNVSASYLVSDFDFIRCNTLEELFENTCEGWELICNIVKGEVYSTEIPVRYNQAGYLENVLPSKLYLECLHRLEDFSRTILQYEYYQEVSHLFDEKDRKLFEGWFENC